MGDDTLRTLCAISRNYRCRRRELCCPDCGGPVLLTGGAYICNPVNRNLSICGWAGTRLAELAIRAG